MTHPANVQDILRQAAILVGKAEALGVTLRIYGDLKPLDQCNPRHVIDAWPARRGPIPAPSGAIFGLRNYVRRTE